MSGRWVQSQGRKRLQVLLKSSILEEIPYHSGKVRNMVLKLNLSKADRERLEATLKAAEPYDPDDPILAFDADFDDARIRATIAKRFLEQDAREKAELAQEQQENKSHT